MNEKRFGLVSDRYGDPVVTYTPTVDEFVADCAECGYYPQLRLRPYAGGDEWWDEHDEPVLREPAEQ